MEKKTIGQFIAVLRKANGMTQKELAERLNVSDKAVSRWERDECAPDLTLIPVIAEIFEVTADELLRGEKKSIEKEESVQETATISRKSEKQLERMLKTAETSFLVKSIIAISVAGVGLIAAMICNLALLRANLGFYVSCVFYLGAAVSLAIFTVMAFASVNGAEVEGMEDRINMVKKRFVSITAKAATVIIMIFAATLPLAMVEDAYVGLTGGWFMTGLAFAVVALLITFVIYKVALRFIIKRGVYMLSETEQEMYKKRDALKKKIAKPIAVLLVITFVLNVVIALIPVEVFAHKEYFDNFEDFKEYMETEEYEVFVGKDGKEYQVRKTESGYLTEKDYAILDMLGGSDVDVDSASDKIYVDRYGNEISEEEARTVTIYDKYGEVYGSFVNRRTGQWSVDWEDDKPKFEVISSFEWNFAHDKQVYAGGAATILFLMCCAGGMLVYVVKRSKIQL